MGLEAALVWKTCTFGLTKKLMWTVSFTKTIELCCDLWGIFLFWVEGGDGGNSIDLILVGKCPLSIIRLEKRRN